MDTAQTDSETTSEVVINTNSCISVAVCIILKVFLHQLLRKLRRLFICKKKKLKDLRNNHLRYRQTTSLAAAILDNLLSIRHLRYHQTAHCLLRYHTLLNWPSLWRHTYDVIQWPIQIVSQCPFNWQPVSLQIVR